MGSELVKVRNKPGMWHAMKPLSQRARALLNQLYRWPQSGQGLRGQAVLDLVTLRELVECGEPAAIPQLAPALLLTTGPEQLALARALGALLAGTGPEDLALLDEATRGSWVFMDHYGETWRRLDPRELARWVGPGEPGALLLRLASFHANGFIREEAVRRLALITDGSELPYLLLRLNDWVSPVRLAAERALAARIGPAYAEPFVQNLALVVRLQRVERVEPRLLEQIVGLLTDPATRPLMIAAMRHGTLLVRRASYRFLTSGSPADLEQVLLAARAVRDPLIRLWSLRRAATALAPDHLLPVVDGLCTDRSAMVRYEALTLLATGFSGKATARLVFGLLDSSPSVRAVARFHLRKRGKFNFATFYRNSMGLAAPSKLAVSIAGLAETGVGTDAQWLIPHLSHPAVRVRRAAVRGVMRLGGEACAHLVLERVLDPAPGVSRAATWAMETYAGSLGGMALWTRFAAPGPGHVRRHLLRLMTALPKWESIGYLVEAAGDADEAIASLALEYIRRWNARYNQGQTVPSHEQTVRLGAALTRWGASLGPEDRSLLELAVRSYSPR